MSILLHPVPPDKDAISILLHPVPPDKDTISILLHPVPPEGDCDNSPGLNPGKATPTKPLSPVGAERLTEPTATHRTSTKPAADKPSRYS